MSSEIASSRVESLPVGRKPVCSVDDSKIP